MRSLLHFLARAFARNFVLAACLTIAAQADPAQTNALPQAPSGAALVYMKHVFDAMKAPVPPRHLIGNIYYVGASGVSSFLIISRAGDVLVDAGFEDTVPQIQSGVAQLGFKLSDIKILVTTHAHFDHVGGLARIKELTDAKLYVSAADSKTLASGGRDDFLPLPKDYAAYRPVQADEIVHDGQVVTLGDIHLVAHLTPGHTRGATTWTLDVRDEDKIYHVVFFSSASINPGTRLFKSPSYPEIVSDYESTFAKLKVLPCDIFFAPHGGQFAMADKFSRLDKGERPNPLIDPEGWKTLIRQNENAFREELAAEKSQP